MASISASMLFARQIVGEPRGAAEAADAHRHRLRAPARRCGRRATASRRDRRGRPAAPPAAAPRVVPPRMRMRGMPLPDTIARETAASPRWLSIVGIGEDGVDGLSARRARPDRRGGDRVRRQAASRPCCAADPRRGAALAEPVRRRGRRGAAPSRPPGLRAGLRRSVPLRRRRRAGAHDRRARDDRRAGALGLQPGGRAARLVVAGHRAALAARPHARSRPPASAARRAHSGPDLRRRRTGRLGAAADATWASAPRG